MLRKAVVGVMMMAGYLAGAQQQTVTEAARQLPLAYDVDVVVVGGGLGAVASAVAAAGTGAKVFLAAPRTYLGEDVAGTLRVWVRSDQIPESDLAKALFGPEAREGSSARLQGRLPLTYKADLPWAPIHADTRKPSKLTDGTWRTAVSESVQYGGRVNITADLGAVKDIGEAWAMVFHAKDFLVQRVTISVSDDGEQWREIKSIDNPAPRGHEAQAALPFAAPVKGRARYVRYLIEPATGCERVLVGEIGVTAPPDPAVKSDPELQLVRPLYLKRALDDALIQAGVPYLFGCYPTDVLRDADGGLAGIVMANRAGRQAVRAKVIVDATERGWVARLAGAEREPFSGGGVRFGRVVVGGLLMEKTDARDGQALPGSFDGFPVYQYDLRLPLADDSFRALAAAEQRARDLTFDPEQQAASDRLFYIPPDPIVGRRQSTGPWPGADALDLDVCRPRNVSGLLVVSGSAAVSREQAAKLVAPLAILRLGTRVGAAAAGEARGRTLKQPVRVPGSAVPAAGGDVREFLGGVRPFTKPEATVEEPARGLPVLGKFDVVVIGGGTAGAPAGIAAARQGVRTLVVEYQNGLGGVGTIGRISKYYWGNRVGFTAEVPEAGGWSVERRKEWWRREIRKAGGEIWFGAIGCGAYVEDGRVRGALVATPEGRGVVLAHCVIDATGNADIAAAAGAACIYTDATDIALQGTGLPPHQLGKDYTNTDYTIVDETDLLDVWHVYVYGKRMAGKSFDFGTLIDTRERRRIAGDFTIRILDELLTRTHPDTVVQAYSNFDTHGYTVHPFFTISYPHKKGLWTNIPLRAMLPNGLDGILVVGLGISAHRDAVPVIRMQPDIQNGGYAAGVAAAMAARDDVGLRELDVKRLQQHLVEVGNLKPEVLEAHDSFPLPEARIRQAVLAPKDPYVALAVILSAPERARPLVREAFAGEQDAARKLQLAQMLAVLGDDAGFDVLLQAIEAEDALDRGWTYRGMGQFGSSMSRLDTFFYALGRIGDRRAVPALLKKLALLDADSAFSHFRALAVGLERLGDPRAADGLAAVLSKPGIRGQVTAEIQESLERAVKHASWTTTEPRAYALRELLLARALFRCGDKDGLGRQVLEEYTHDLRGHFARHAQAVLDAGPSNWR